MRKIFAFFLFVLFVSVLCGGAKAIEALPKGFVYVDDVAGNKNVQIEMRYFGSDNFVGAPVDGYNAPRAVLTREAANAIAKANGILEKQGYLLKIFDAYRPDAAVRHFVRWSKDPNDLKTKQEYYPTFDKPELFKRGYISSTSNHSKGSTVDLTMVHKDTLKEGILKEVDMGSPFDFFGKISAHDSPLINEQQSLNRKILKMAMDKAGFNSAKGEWWHYTLRNEPFPKKRFDFPVE